MKVLILYYSKSGHTLEAANATAEGIKSSGSEVEVVTIDDFQVSTLSDYDGVIAGSPCWAGSITSAGIARPIKKVLKALPNDSLKGKRCGGISVHSKIGGENTVAALGKLSFQKGCEEFISGPAAKAGSGMSLRKGTSVSADDEERFNAFGKEFVA